MRYPSYRYPCEALFTGSSLGNRYAFLQLDALSQPTGLWSSSDNEYYAGSWTSAVTVGGAELQPVETIIRPESQATILGDGPIRVERTIFLPLLTDETATDLRAAIMLVRCENRSAAVADIVVRHNLVFAAVPSELHTKKPPEEQTRKSFEIHARGSHFDVLTSGRPLEARVFGSTFLPSSEIHDDYSLTTEYRFTLKEGECFDVPFVLSFSPEGCESALKSFFAGHDGRGLLDRSVDHYREILSRSELVTPEPVINRGVQWAKVNMLRVQHEYRAGSGFTNDPPQDIVVIRDLGWYLLGSDYLTPEFSRRLLDLCGQHAFHEGGKLTEFIHADEQRPELHDYDLNINDDTPLYMMGLYHHMAVSEPAEYVVRSYPLMKRAADWIVSQIDNGLVRCTATGTGVWGICGWRNIIEDYTIAGTVTEVNVECFHALMLTAAVAKRIGSNDEAARYEHVAHGLLHAINSRLVSEKTGFYLLTREMDGTPRHDVTGDLVFPLMFGEMDSDLRERLFERLTADGFWTEFGSRTVSRTDPSYNSEDRFQLMGGVWPNLTAWVAYAGRREHPDRLVEGMINIYRISEAARPADFRNVVPGEFPERLHGETYASMGMAMSPWMPPTYLWLAVEGLAGFSPSLDGLSVNPSLPKNWRWLGLSNVPYRGGSVTVAYHEGTLYATQTISTKLPLIVGDRVPTESDTPEFFTAGFKTREALLIFVATDTAVEGNVSYDAEGSRHTLHVKLGGGGAVLLKPSSTD